MAGAIVADKTALRQAMLERRAAQPPGIRAACAAALARHAGAIARMANGGIVSGFTAFRDEIDPLPLLEALAGAGHRLTLPRVAGPHLTFHVWTPGDPLVRGRYGQPEPQADAPELRPDVMLVPLLAFDRRGHRLGYGGGFFDRVLADYGFTRTVGLAYAMQEVAAVPVEPHDQPLAGIATERELIDCRAQQGQ
jgi:5-formyltetrahydrofolate cyclo-ligase